MFELRRASLALVGAVVTAACLVPNVELVERLPGGGGSAVGGSSPGASGDSQGGDLGSSEGGEVSNAGSTTAGVGGSGEGGAPGGSSGSSGVDGGGGVGGGGSSSGGSAGSGGVWMFGGDGACATEGPLFCDDFEVQRLSNWGAGPLWQRNAIADAPSPTRVMQTVFKDAQMVFVKPTSTFNLSFWVRFPSLTDQAFITWPVAEGNLSFGLEESSFRFRLDSNPITVAPELAKHTRGATVNVWTCVDIDVIPDSEFRARVTVFGEPPLELASLGGAPTPGVDEKLLQSIPGGALTLGDTSWTLGQLGVELDIDDVRVVDSGKPSVCDDFLAANQ